MFVLRRAICLCETLPCAVDEDADEMRRRCGWGCGEYMAREFFLRRFRGRVLVILSGGALSRPEVAALASSIWEMSIVVELEIGLTASKSSVRSSRATEVECTFMLLTFWI